MNRITVTIPKKNQQWKVAFNGGRLKKKDATLIYKHCERRLLASLQKGKTHVMIKNGSEVINSGKYDSKYEALYVLCCFLEDYLLIGFRKMKEKKYFTLFQ